MGCHLRHRRPGAHGGPIRGAMDMHVAGRGRSPGQAGARAEARRDIATFDAGRTQPGSRGDRQRPFGMLVTAVLPKAFEQAFGMLGRAEPWRSSACRRVASALPIFDTVLKRITVRGSIVGTRQDLEEALAFAVDGAVAAHFAWDEIDNINVDLPAHGARRHRRPHRARFSRGANRGLTLHHRLLGSGTSSKPLARMQAFVRSSSR